MIHIIEVTKDIADEILNQNKTFEIMPDKGYKVGDFIKYEVIDQEGMHMKHDLNYKGYKISYLIKCTGIVEHYVVFSFKEVEL